MILLFGPGTLHQVWVQHSEPPVLTLLVTAVLGTELVLDQGLQSPDSSKSGSSPQTHRLYHRKPAEAHSKYKWRSWAQGTGHRDRNLNFSPQLQQTRPGKPSVKAFLPLGSPISQLGAMKSEQSPTAETQGTNIRRSSNMQTLGFPAGHRVTYRKVAGQELPVILPIMAH